MKARRATVWTLAGLAVAGGVAAILLWPNRDSTLRRAGRPTATSGATDLATDVRAQQAVVARSQRVPRMHAGNAPELDPRAHARALVFAVMDLFMEHLETSPGYQAFLACAQEQPRSECQHLFDSSVLFALETVVGPAIRERTIDLAAFVEMFGADLAREGLIEELRGSPDDLARMAALALLGDDVMGLTELPAFAYEGLADKSVPEFLMLMDNRHTTHPVNNPGVAGQLAMIATDPVMDVRKRYAAITSLGHPQTSSELVGTVHDLVGAGEIPADVGRRVSSALGRCGERCAEAFLALLRTGREDNRIVLYGALPVVPSGERERLWWMLAGGFPLIGAMSEQERFAYQRVRDLISG